MTPLRLEAPAKLNLSLRVTGRRADGLHELDSRFVLLDLADQLMLLPGCSGFRVEGEGAASLPVDGTNLAWRGLVAGMDGEPDLACLALEKRIPAAAGLAGGSSDAAAAWRLGRVWRGMSDRATPDELDSLTQIGADVPFFVAQVPAARVRGIGERIEEVAAEALHVVLVHPPFGLSTAAVFAELERGEWGTAENDLLAPARRLRPEIDDLFRRVRGAGGDPRLTGSGPTVFMVTNEPDRAAAVASLLHDDGLRVTLTATRQGPAAIEAIEEE